MTTDAPARPLEMLDRVWSDGRAAMAARWYLRHADVVGARVRVRGRPVIKNWGRLEIGSRTQLVSTIATLELVAMEGGTLEIGERTLVNYGGSIAAAERVSIGARCLIGTHAIIIDNDFHRLEPERRLETPQSGPITIEDNVWIGARVIVLPGVVIGADSCIGAGSVVNADIPPRSLAVGVPARVIREL
jgi:acetyltransferase-like isoleucine patch superfamily enzyme